MMRKWSIERFGAWLIIAVVFMAILLLAKGASAAALQDKREAQILEGIVNSIPSPKPDSELLRDFMGDFVPAPIAPPRALAIAERGAFERAIKAKLTDEESARFKWGQLSDRSLFCASVNSKNRFGGYVGFTVVMMRYTRKGAGITVDLSSIHFADRDADGRLIADEVLRRCAAAGYTVSSEP